MIRYNYTCKKNILMLIAMLKKRNIKKVIVSPGTTNVMFVMSIQQDSWFEIYSAADERSAAYMACGMAAESGEPVVISCTGATASRNYMPGLTEAFYRKLPIVVVTSMSDSSITGQLMPQIIDRSVLPNDIVVESVELPEIKDSNDEQKCVLRINKVFNALLLNGGGPIHINLTADFSYDFSITELPSIRNINVYGMYDEFPRINKEARLGIFIGAHREWTAEQVELIDKFCDAYNAVVFCDHSSNYHGRYAVNYSLVAGQEQINRNNITVDLVIDLGSVSGDYYLMPVKESWRVSEEYELRDRFKKLTKQFVMKEEFFFKYYVNCEEESQKKTEASYYNDCQKKYEDILNKIPELPFSNLWVAQNLCDKMPKNSVIHFGILNSLRSWNFFRLDKSICASSNVGGFGIDGGLSTLIGASLVHPDKLYFGVIGDLAFFYDMNSLGNRHIGKNLRILLVNNGIGTEFKNYSHPASLFEEDANKYIAASGHYGDKSSDLVKHYAQDLGFTYLHADSKESFYENYEMFISPSIQEKPIIFEVFTDSEDESHALEMIRNIVTDNVLKHRIKKIVGVQNIQKIKDIIKK